MTYLELCFGDSHFASVTHCDVGAQGMKFYCMLLSPMQMLMLGAECTNQFANWEKVRGSMATDVLIRDMEDKSFISIGMPLFFAAEFGSDIEGSVIGQKPVCSMDVNQLSNRYCTMGLSL